ncbi:MAG: phosphatidylglycerol:prolipoprotein diacylglycerol transferase [Anaerolineaceae bacterium]|nr:MAG: phosphatidylglycerol:prolipoprotein diacylglycerol transferase [Anaerolineaceae bacterium]
MYPVLFTIGAWEVKAPYVFTTLGILLGVLVGWREARRAGFSTRHILTFAAAAIPAALLLGVVNGILFRLLLRWDVLGLHEFFTTGLVSFGAVLGALLTGWIFARLRKQSAETALDVIALSLPLILGVYRIGCLLNGCCYGVRTDGFWGVFLPGRFGEWANRYPTQIMYMLLDFAIFGFLWWRRAHKPVPGSQTVIFLLLFSAGRLLIDSLRDLPRVFLGMNFHQLVSLVILLAALGFAAASKLRGRHTVR